MRTIAIGAPHRHSFLVFESFSFYCFISESYPVKLSITSLLYVSKLRTHMWMVGGGGAVI